MVGYICIYAARSWAYLIQELIISEFVSTPVSMCGLINWVLPIYAGCHKEMVGEYVVLPKSIQYWLINKKSLNTLPNWLVLYVFLFLLYVPWEPGFNSVSCFVSCLAEIKNWMSKNVLQLNDSKSDVVIVTPFSPSASSMSNLPSRLGTLSNNVHKEALQPRRYLWLRAVCSCAVNQSVTVLLWHS